MCQIVSTVRFLFVCFCFALLNADAASAQVVFSADFDQYEYSGRYRDWMLSADFNDPEWENGVSRRRIKITDGYHAWGNGTSLEVKYPKRQHGPGNTGGQWVTELPGRYDEAIMSYDVKFKRGFDFVKGGKLPGLAGGTVPTGNTAATGTNGWTARLMWRTDHNGDPGKPVQKTSPAISYAKYVGSGFDGDGKDEDKSPLVTSAGDRFKFRSNRWYQISQRVRMNDPWKNNGVLQIWIDGQLVLDQQDIRFRTTSNLGIDKFFFSTFFGGGSSWRTSKWETAYFDNFTVIAVD